MAYLSFVIWVLVVVLTAYGVHRLLSGLIKPKVLDAILLPGTVTAILGHTLGVIVTGGSIDNTADGEGGEPTPKPNPNLPIPVLGPIVIGLFPLVLCGFFIYTATAVMGGPLVRNVRSMPLDGSLPTSLAAFWDLLRDQITLAESMLSAVASTGLNQWQTWLFVYLLICLTVRMAPYPGYLRGALAAVVIFGGLAAATAVLMNIPNSRIETGWTVLNLTVGTLLLLLLVSLTVRMVVGLVHILRKETA